ncbi:MAG: hypothetical protein KDC61_21960 [Saprospiraceae bacterium]|nr:hypothetical protein [Saprospiraceae bacterium]MCB0545338.1 hypothetical protein [Saprospiraceae bacterium]MCB0577241.1 hypothetical protein [Saprospiraceae bacterium]
MRSKRNSRIFSKALQRLAGLKSIDPGLDLGADMSVAVFEQHIQSFEQKLSNYNTMISVLDAEQQQVQAAEKQLLAYTVRWLSMVGGHFGMDSEEYQKAGGVRKSLRKRARRSRNVAIQVDLPLADSLQTA